MVPVLLKIFTRFVEGAGTTLSFLGEQYVTERISA
jgi:hypothetical protein